MKCEGLRGGNVCGVQVGLPPYPLFFLLLTSLPNATPTNFVHRNAGRHIPCMQMAFEHSHLHGWSREICSALQCRYVPPPLFSPLPPLPQAQKCDLNM